MKDIIEQYIDAREDLYELGHEVCSFIKDKIYKRLLEIKGPEFNEEDKIVCCGLPIFLGVARNYDNPEEQETDFFNFIRVHKDFRIVKLESFRFVKDECKGWQDRNFHCFVDEDYKVLMLNTADAYLWLDETLERIGFYSSDNYVSYSYTE